jgi:hypothetical protein
VSEPNVPIPGPTPQAEALDGPEGKGPESPYCLPRAGLIALASRPAAFREEEWPEHVRACPVCRDRLLGYRRAGERLRERLAGGFAERLMDANGPERVWAFDWAVGQPWTRAEAGRRLAWATFLLQAASSLPGLPRAEQRQAQGWLDAGPIPLWACLRDRRVGDGRSVAAALCDPDGSPEELLAALPPVEEVPAPDGLTVGQVVECLRAHGVVPLPDRAAEQSGLLALVDPGSHEQYVDRMTAPGFWGEIAGQLWGRVDPGLILRYVGDRKQEIRDTVAPAQRLAMSWELGQAALGAEVRVPFEDTEAALTLQPGPDHRGLRLTFEGTASQERVRAVVQHLPSGNTPMVEIPRGGSVTLFGGEFIDLRDLRVTTRGVFGRASS